jgi:small GTP-binding protein
MSSGVDYCSVVAATSDGLAKARLKVWDTAGQERYRAIATSHLRSASVLVLVFSCVDRFTFETIEYWTKLASDSSAAPMVLVGSKVDLVDASDGEAWPVRESDARAVAARLHAPVFFTSARTRAGVDELLAHLADMAVAAAAAAPPPPPGPPPPVLAPVGPAAPARPKPPCAC